MKPWIGIAFLVLTNIHTARGQSPKACLEAGLSACAEGSYGHAIELIERATWFDPALRTLQSDLTLSRAYAKTSDYHDATQVLDHRLAQADLPDSSRVEILMQYAWVSMINNRLPEMKYWMLRVDTGYSPDQYERAHVLRGSAYFLNGDFDEAEAQWLQHEAFDDSVKQAQLDSVFRTSMRYHKKKPLVASLLSIALPGLGQLYAREPGEALNSLLLNSGTASLYILTLSSYGYIEATILAYPWFLRYYKGGYERAADLVKQRKQRRLIDGLDEVVRIASDN